MLALQHSNFMGLSVDGAFHAAVTETVAERVARIRNKMIGGGATTLIFAGAFKLAKSEQVWAPSLWLGGVSAVASLLSVALAAKTAADEANEQAAAAEQTTSAPLPPAAY